MSGTPAITPANSVTAQTVFDGVSNTVQTLTITPPTTTNNVDPSVRITLTLNGATTDPLDFVPGISPTPADVASKLFACPA